MNALSFGLSGMLLAACLGIAEPLTERNVPRVVRNGALGAMLGLIGGVGVSLFVDKIYRAVGGGISQDATQFTGRDVQRNVFQDLARAKILGDLADFQQGRRGVHGIRWRDDGSAHCAAFTSFQISLYLARRGTFCQK